MKGFPVCLFLAAAQVALVASSPHPVTTATCRVGTRTLAPGNSVVTGCQSCTCQLTGQLICTNVNCPCKTHKQTYQHGYTFNVGCNQCSCDNGKITCTKKKCCRSGNKWLSPKQTINVGCQSCTCMETGLLSCRNVNCPCAAGRKRKYQHGQAWALLCNTCTCENGVIKCTKNSCCRVGKKWVPDGHTYKQSCNTCTCTNTLLTCTQLRCCRYGKRMYGPLETFKAGCQKCRCEVTGKITCKNLDCPCRYGKRSVAHLATFQVTCNTCGCDNAKLSCTKKACCRHGDKWYTEGDQLTHKCNLCTCLATKKRGTAVWGCLRRQCPAGSPANVQG